MYSLIGVSVKRRLGLRVGSGSGSVVASHFFFPFLFFFFFFAICLEKDSFWSKKYLLGYNGISVQRNYETSATVHVNITSFP